jgi:hypothetical protein
VIKTLKPSRRSFFASVEAMERREVLSNATVEMVPGSALQTLLPFPQGTLVTVDANILTVVRDINNKSIDFNNDGSPDLLNIEQQVVFNGDSPLFAGMTTMPLLSSLGRFSQTLVDGDVSAFGRGVAVLDWNGDGNQDYLGLGASGISSGFRYSIYQNDGKGVFTTAIDATLPGPFQVDIEAQILCMADFNSDGAPDMLAPTGRTWRLFNGVVAGGKWNGLFDTTNVQVIAGDGNDTIYSNPTYTDFNGDGKLDFVIPMATGLRLFINDGTGQFPSGGSLDLPGLQNKALSNVVAADFNNDGKTDLAASTGTFAGGFLGQASLFLNTTPAPTSSNPTFAAAYGAGSNEGVYGQLAAADMNLDGYIDLVVAPASENGTNTYNILTNDGTGQFPDQRVFNAFILTSCKPAGIGVGDWNNDGQPDVATGIGWIRKGYPDDRASVAGGVSISINDTYQPLGISDSSFPPARAGVPYSYQVKFNGGDSQLPYNVTLSPEGSKLPAGLTVSPTGLISGTPTQGGNFQPLFNITQPHGMKGQALAYLQVTSVPQLNISPGALANAVAGIAYSQPFSTNFGPAQWAITQGALPAGMVLSANGVLSGTPTVLGQYNFLVTAVAPGYQTSLNYVLNVQSVAAPIVTSLKRYGYHAQPTTLVATFSQTLDAAAAGNVGNYVLTSAGADGRFGTRDDRNIALASAGYNAQAKTVTLGLVQKNIPLRQLYRLAITGTPTAGLQNTGGTFLGGQGIGAPGTNYIQIFNGKILAGPNLLLKNSKVKSGR